MSNLAVICRSCGHEAIVARDRQGGTWVPNECPRCESDDLVSLAELDRAELEEIERVVNERRER